MTDRVDQIRRAPRPRSGKTVSDQKTRHRKRIRRAAMLIGVLAGIACNFAPPDYQEACHAVTKALSLTCGGT